MNKTRLKFKSVTEIVGSDDGGLLIFVDEQEQRQIVIPCDRDVLYQFGMRMQPPIITKLLLPEVLWQIVRTHTELHFEVLINDLVDGQYRSILYDTTTLQPIPIRVCDALLLAFFSRIPIYIDERLMRRQSVEYVGDTAGMAIPVNTLTDDMLRRALAKAIQDENYELASQLRDEMKRRNLSDA